MNNRCNSQLVRLRLSRSVSGLVCALLLALMAVQTGHAASQELPERITDRVFAMAYTAKLDEKTVNAFMHTLSHAAAEDFPVEPLVQKIEEGLAKNVAPARIATALETMTRNYETFSEMLGQHAQQSFEKRERLLERMGDVYAMGISEEEIESRIATADDTEVETILNGLDTKAALLRLGFNSQAAEDVLNSGLAHGDFRESPDWELVRFAKSAKEQGLTMQRIETAAMQAVTKKAPLQAVAKQNGITYQQSSQKSTTNSSSSSSRNSGNGNGSSGNSGGNGGSSGGSGGNGGGSGGNGGGNGGSGGGGNGGGNGGGRN